MNEITTTTVYRIEAVMGDEIGTGPYNTSPPYESLHYTAKHEALNLIDSWDDDTHPAPHNDPGLDGIDEESEVCGFADIEQLLRWFHSGSLRVLCSTGFYQVFACTLRTEDVRVGRCQVVFDPANTLDRVAADVSALDPMST